MPRARPRDKDILEQKPLSVVTGRTMDEIAKGATGKKVSGKTSKKKSSAAKTSRNRAQAKAAAILRRTKKVHERKG